MVKSCVGGGREESFSEHPDGVQIFVCGFLCVDFCVWIFLCEFMCADFGFFVCGFQCGFLTRIFFEDFLGRETAGRATKKSLK